MIGHVELLFSFGDGWSFSSQAWGACSEAWGCGDVIVPLALWEVVLRCAGLPAWPLFTGRSVACVPVA